MNLFIKLVRDPRSYEYKKNPQAPDEWWNNDANNSLDSFILYDDEEAMFEAACQSVSNLPHGRYEDTVAPGPFKIRAFVENRRFYGRIHGICECYDLEGQWIDSKSVQKNDATRWLVHDTQSMRPKPPMQLTRVAWSAGCFIMSPSNLEALGKIFDAYNVKPGMMIPGILEDA